MFRAEPLCLFRRSDAGEVALPAALPFVGERENVFSPPVFIVEGICGEDLVHRYVHVQFRCLQESGNESVAVFLADLFQEGRSEREYVFGAADTA